MSFRWVVLVHTLVFVCFQSIQVLSKRDGPMNDDTRIREAIQDILKFLRQSHDERSALLERSRRPCVTLSFAQSLDGKLAPFVPPTTTSTNDNATATASNFVLSGKETMQMTHAIRSINDGILVGGRTLSIDNPRLTNRLWANQQGQPRPIVLDPTLRHTALMMKEGRHLRAKRLVVFCSNNTTPHEDDSHRQLLEYLTSECGCEIVPCSTLENGHLDLHQVLSILWNRYGMRSLMVEGGGSILSSFLELGLFDSLCVTIAPRMLLGSGLDISTSEAIPLGRLVQDHAIRWKQLGSDMVLLMSATRLSSSPGNRE